MNVRGVRLPSAGSKSRTKKWTNISTQAVIHRWSRADLTCRRSATKMPTMTANTRMVGSLSNILAISAIFQSGKHQIYHGQAQKKRWERLGASNLSNRRVTTVLVPFRENCFDPAQPQPLYCKHAEKPRQFRRLV